MKLILLLLITINVEAKNKTPYYLFAYFKGNQTSEQQIYYAISTDGVSVYPLTDGTWMMMYDCFKTGHYEFCKSSDLAHFELVKKIIDFRPRHGSVVRIT